MDHMTETGASEARDVFIAGLRNVHALETQALSIIETQLGRIESYPEMRAMLQQHHQETQGQIGRLDQIFEMLGESPSGLKDTLLSAMGSMSAMAHSLASDEILKNHMANYMFEHFEIASYTALIVMANSVRATTAVPLLEQNLAEEQRFASMLIESLPAVTEKFMQRTASGQPASV